MIFGIGTDIIDISRIRKAIEANPRFVDKIFTAKEIAYCSQRAMPYQSYAVRFAAKEAVMKAIGTGWDGVINWQDIEIVLNDKGKPSVCLYGASKQFTEAQGITGIHISLSHEKEFAIAYAVLEIGKAAWE